MPKAKTQANKENAPAEPAKETTQEYKLEEGKGEDDSGEESESSDEEAETKAEGGAEPVSFYF